MFSLPDSAHVLVEAMHAFGGKYNYPIAINQENTLKSITYDLEGNFPLAMEYLQKSLAANQKLGNKSGILECHIVIGVLYNEQGNYPRALEHYTKALVVDEEIGNKGGMSMSLNNIGNIYFIQGDYLNALENYEKSLAIDQELGVK